MPIGITGCSGEMYITKRSGEMGEPSGVPTATGEKSLGTWEEQSTYAIGEATANPCSEVFVGPFGTRRRLELAGIDIVKAALDVQEKSRDLRTKSLEEANLMGEVRCGVESGETLEGPCLVRVE